MTFEPLSREDAQSACEALKQHGSKRAAAAALGIDRATLRNRLRRAAEYGLTGFAPVMEGFVVDRVSYNDKTGEAHVRQVREPGDVFAVPAGHRVKGVSAKVDPEGRLKEQWIKTREGELDPLTVIEWLKAAMVDYKSGHVPLPAPESTLPELLTLFPANDWHVGMHAWGREVGADWDLKIAERSILGAVREVIARSPMAGTCIVLGGGDLLHADNSLNRTLQSGNALDVDGRYQKVLATAERMMVATVEAALQRNARVIVRILPGNHDEHTAYAIAHFLLAWFRNDDRVTVDADPSLFFWHRFGNVMLGATHGHTVKLKQMPSIMAHRRAREWGETAFRYVHGFHIHHTEKLATEGEGVICEAHQAPIPQDAWHYGAGYLSGRSLQTITYHRDHGEISRSRVAILDGEKQ